MDEQGEKEREPETMSDEDMKLLQDPQLLLYIVREVQAEGIQGCEDAIIVLVNKLTLRKVKGVEPTSCNILISDESGAGKDVITKKTLKVVVLETEYVHRNHMSERALVYWGTNKLKGWTWDGKVLYLEDPETDLIQSQTFKVMASGENIGSTVRDQQLLELKVKGKPVLIVTSMAASINYEGERRWDALRLDTSKELTTQVIRDALYEFEGGKKKIIDSQLRHALWHGLQPCEVIFPYARILEEHLPNNLVMRTKVHNLKDYIKASAVLHQHQRKKDEQGRLIATLDDYEYGRFVFIHLNDAQGGGLNRDEEEFVRVLQEADRPLTINEITSKYRRHGKTWIYDHLESFKQKGLILEEYKKQKSGTVDKDVREISLTKQVIEQGLPDKSVFLRFIETSENGIQDSIPGIPGFTDICKEIDKVRMETNLKPLFSAQSQEKQENKEDNLEEGDSQTEENLRKILEKQHDERNMQ